MLKTQDAPSATPNGDVTKNSAANFENLPKTAQREVANFAVSDPAIAIASSRDQDRWQFQPDDSPQNVAIDDFQFNSNIALNMNGVDGNFTWEMIGLGLEEPLPTQEVIDELYVLPRMPPETSWNKTTGLIPTLADTRSTLRRSTRHYP
jgi:hypothetical protein